MNKKTIHTAVVGASGYTGAELVRLLQLHPHAEIKALVADSNAGKQMRDIYSHFHSVPLPQLTKLDDVTWKDIHVAFCCLPHGTSQEVIAQIADHKHIKIIDLSADFRIKDAKLYETWYGISHTQDTLRDEAVYGLTELKRDAIKKARLIACPGCYPTSILLPLMPLIKNKLIAIDSIIADAKSGITGAGRAAKQQNLFAEINENLKPYGVGGHRHVAEIEQELSNETKQQVIISFTPQVIPVNRGILTTLYVKGDAKDIKAALHTQYDTEPFVHVMNHAPTLRDVVSTNQAAMAVYEDRIAGQAIIISVIDNLVKGASGQAVQNMNLLHDLPETTGLEALPVFP